MMCMFTQTVRAELSRCQRALAKEVGDDANVAKLLEARSVTPTRRAARSPSHVMLHPYGGYIESPRVCMGRRALFASPCLPCSAALLCRWLRPAPFG
eukprot:5313475-Pleurochrysis_carterae.AAC.1